VTVTEGDGQHHIALFDRPTTSIGTVARIHPTGRDRVMLPFPCFEIEARFDAGMSGGLVVDQSGVLCGVMCTGFQLEQAATAPVSYAASLGPMLTTVISIDRGDRYPRGVHYPMIELAIDGLLEVTDLHEFLQANGEHTRTASNEE
jgi:hypothetical protein